MALSDTPCKAKWILTYWWVLSFKTNVLTVINGDINCVNSWAVTEAKATVAERYAVPAYSIKHLVLSGPLFERHVHAREKEAERVTSPLDITNFELLRITISVL